MFYHSLLFKIQSGEIELRNDPKEAVLGLAALFVFIEVKPYNLFEKVSLEHFNVLLPKFTKFYQWDDSLSESCFLKFQTLSHHMSIFEAKAKFVQLGNTLRLYGAEGFHIETLQDFDKRQYKPSGECSFWICPTKISISSYSFKNGQYYAEILKEVSYPHIHNVSYTDNNLNIQYDSKDLPDRISRLVVGMFDFESTISIFKTFTEFHTFFYCRAVRKNISDRLVFLHRSFFNIFNTFHKTM